MNTTTPKRSLRSLEKQLQQCLDAQLLENSPIQVRCAIKNADLLVLAQHEAEFRPDLQQTFKAIHQAILSLSPELAGELRLYLRVLGQVQPYAYHAFKLPQPLGAVKTAANDVSPLAAFAWLEKLIEDHGNPRATTETDPSEAPESSDLVLSNEILSNENRLALSPEAEATEKGELRNLQELDEFPSGLFNELNLSKDVDRQTIKFKELPSWWGQVSAYLFLSIALCSVGLYAFTRPCVLGKCTTLAQAQQEIDAAQKILTSAKYAQHFAQVQEKFSLATEQLEQIPVWSGKYLQARRMVNNYEIEATQIDQVMTALETGAAAWKKAQNAPLPLERWREIEASWSKAIALLEKIPPQSEVYSFAQNKLSEYEANLQAIAARVQEEESATKTLQEIREKADLAYTRQGVASGLESWQGIYDLWEEIVNLIPKIAPSTTAYVQLQDSVVEYRKQLTKARQQEVQENISQETYDMAIAAAEQAQELSEQKQWSNALNSWTDALTLARQIPDNTFYSAKAQSLVTSYTNARNEAAVNLKKATILQKTQSDLKKLCNGNPLVCEYTVTEEVINVWLTPAYIRNVKRTALLADQKGDKKVLVGIDKHLETLKVALQTISDNAKIPLMLYDSYGGLIGRHPKN
jgi:hypothetical protein